MWLLPHQTMPQLPTLRQSGWRGVAHLMLVILALLMPASALPALGSAESAEQESSSEYLGSQSESRWGIESRLDHRRGVPDVRRPVSVVANQRIGSRIVTQPGETLGHCRANGLLAPLRC